MEVKMSEYIKHILGIEKILRWRKAENMMRSKSDFNKVKMNYALVAPQI